MVELYLTNDVEFPPEVHSSYRVMFDVIAKNQNRKKTQYKHRKQREKNLSLVEYVLSVLVKNYISRQLVILYLYLILNQ